LRTNTSKLLLAGLAFALWNSKVVGQRSGSAPVTFSPGDVLTYARLLQLADTRGWNDSLLHLALSNASLSVRGEAALVAAQLVSSHRDLAVPLLRSLLGDRDSTVASNAAFGLGLARDTVSLQQLTDLIRRAKDEPASRSSPAAETAAWALGEIGSPAEQSLSSLLKERFPSGVTTELLLAEAGIKSLDVTAVLPHLSDKNMTVVWAAAYAIAQQHERSGVAALLHLNLAGTDEQIRAQIGRALTMQAVGDSLQQEALALLSTLLRDEYPQVRVAAVRSSGTYGRIARLPVIQSTQDDDPNVRIAAAQVAGMVVGSDGEDWNELWNADTSFAYRRSILESSVRAGAPLPVLSTWRVSRDWRYRAAAVSAWQMSSDTLEAKLAALLASYDVDGRVRAASYSMLVAMDVGRHDSVVQNILRRAETDTDLVVRESLPWYKRIPTAIDSESMHHTVEWYEGVVRDIVVPTLRGPAYAATIVTNRGTIRLALLGAAAPLTVRNFIVLANRGYFNGLHFHRVVPAFVVQDGDPRGDGNGGPGYVIRDELTREQYRRGAVGMALSGPDTGGSQYFLTLSPQPHLDGHYPLFARVVSGLAAMDALVEGDLIKAITVP
jgi:cyclophilin family peptidyl-prolyl cis-trans isomerase